MGDLLSAFPDAAAAFLDPANVLAVVAGTVIGYVFGLVPGLQSVTAMVAVLPFTFYMEPIPAMYLLSGILGATGRGGSIPAICLNMPGTVQNAATALDGYPMAQRGKVTRAISIATSASTIGSLIGIGVLVVIIPFFVPILLLFGPAEIFWIILFGVVVLCLVMTGPLIRNLVAVGIGILLASIGFGGPGLYSERFTFGSVFLLDGLMLVPVVIGLLVAGEAIGNLVRGRTDVARAEGVARFRFDWPEIADGLKTPLRYPGLLLRSSAIGTFVGALPGAGGVVAQFMSYNAAWVASKNREEFGHGSEEGLIAAETAVDAKEGGNLLPTFTFGIPGNGEMALLLAAWQIHGLQPGVFFLQRHADIAWAIIIGLLVSNILVSAIQAASMPLVSRIPALSPVKVAIVVLGLSVVAALLVRSSVWDAVVVLACGLLAYLLRSSGFSVIAIVIGFVLGGMLESSYYSALQSGLGDHLTLLASTPSRIIFALTVVAIGYAMFRRLRPQRSSTRAEREALASDEDEV